MAPGLQEGHKMEELQQLGITKRVWTVEKGRRGFESCLCHYYVTLGSV